MITVQPFKACPKCGHHKYSVIESREAAQGKRRRWECKQCKYRETTYEVEKSRYMSLIDKEKLFDKIIALTGGPTFQGSQIATCEEDCHHWSKNGCTFGFPEAGGAYAEECSNYELDKDLEGSGNTGFPRKT
jgi:predicted nucleic-acid-binding Zn-ribbon protein